MAAIREFNGKFFVQVEGGELIEVGGFTLPVTFSVETEKPEFDPDVRHHQPKAPPFTERKLPDRDQDEEEVPLPKADPWPEPSEVLEDI